MPASKAEVGMRNANLQNDIASLQSESAALTAEVATLTAENAADQALLNTVVAQVNKLTPVSLSTATRSMLVYSWQRRRMRLSQ